MCFLLIRHTVKNYSQWKPIYDEHVAARKAAGCRNEQLFRSLSDPNEVTILFEWDNANDAEIFVESEDLRNTMQRAGVIGQPEVRYLEQLEKKSLVIGRVLRAG